MGKDKKPSVSPADVELLKFGEFQLSEIAKLFCVPPHLIVAGR